MGIQTGKSHHRQEELVGIGQNGTGLGAEYLVCPPSFSIAKLVYLNYLFDCASYLQASASKAVQGLPDATIGPKHLKPY